MFADAKRTRGARPTLLVVDEAHNYVPERTTGFMAEAARHGSLHALTNVAVEARKFGFGLVLVSQRPSRIAKDVLAQMLSQLVFRLANLEDLAYVRESFEAAGSVLMADLPQLDRGVCVCAGTMVDMPVRCDVPLFAPRWTFDLGPGRATGPGSAGAGGGGGDPEGGACRGGGGARRVCGPAGGSGATRADGGYALDVDCVDGELAERVRDAVEHALPPVPPLSKSASAELPQDS